MCMFHTALESFFCLLLSVPIKQLWAEPRTLIAGYEKISHEVSSVLMLYSKLPMSGAFLPEGDINNSFLSFMSQSEEQLVGGINFVWESSWEYKR